MQNMADKCKRVKSYRAMKTHGWPIRKYSTNSNQCNFHFARLNKLETLRSEESKNARGPGLQEELREN